MQTMQRSKLKNTLTFIAFILLVTLSIFVYLKPNITAIDLPTYQKILDDNGFESAYIKDGEVVLKSDGKLYSIIIDGVKLDKLLEHVPIELKDDEDYDTTLFLATFLLSTLIFLYIFDRFKRDSEKKSEKKGHSYATNSQFYKRSNLAVKTDVTFDDVAGIDEVKEELVEIINFLKDPKKYKDFGIKLPKGVLLVGPPGVGKTMIAKAMANEANVPFFYQSGASFVHIYVGMGAKRVKELFDSAKKESPAIIFIDEIDAVGKSRGGAGQNDEREATLNQLLIEMDGFDDSSTIIVIAATNQIDVLDEALLRAGRFDRRVHIPLPNISERKKILKVHLKDKKHTLNIDEIAKSSVGFSGATLATFVNEAAIYALNRGSKKIEFSDFKAVKDKVVSGKKKALSYTKEERKIQAIYQASKALSAYWYDVEFDKISIIGDNFIEQDREFESKSSLLAKIKVYLSGKVATEILYDESYTNAAPDLNKAKLLATKMVEQYGMGDGIISTTMDSANILDEAISDVEGFLYKTKSLVKEISEILLKDEYITSKRLKSIVDEVL